MASLIIRDEVSYSPIWTANWGHGRAIGTERHWFARCIIVTYGRPMISSQFCLGFLRALGTLVLLAKLADSPFVFFLHTKKHHSEVTERPSGSGSRRQRQAVVIRKTGVAVLQKLHG